MPRLRLAFDTNFRIQGLRHPSEVQLIRTVDSVHDGEDRGAPDPTPGGNQLPAQSWSLRRLLRSRETRDAPGPTRSAQLPCPRSQLRLQLPGAVCPRNRVAVARTNPSVLELHCIPRSQCAWNIKLATQLANDIMLRLNAICCGLNFAFFSRPALHHGRNARDQHRFYSTQADDRAVSRNGRFEPTCCRSPREVSLSFAKWLLPYPELQGAK